MLAKEGKRLQQSLSPFLSTPLRSDAAEVGEILKESLNRILEDTRGSEDPSGPSLSTGLFVTPSVRKTRDRELFHRGSADAENGVRISAEARGTARGVADERAGRNGGCGP